ncbi:serine/threonine kinase [Minicystis rosea]|nr:serine/threonine kinase [Minicystis rosea]
MLDRDAAPGLDPDDRPIEIHGPHAEAERIVQRGSPARLALRLAVAVAVLAAGAGSMLRARLWYAERLARRAPMVHIPGGPVRIGSDHGPPEERPEHEVVLRPFDIDLTEVTVAAYAACAQRGPCTAPRRGDFCNWGKQSLDDHPINCVDHAQASAYCAWAGKRLPTEKEWEHAARGGDGRLYPWGDGAPSADRLNACGIECRAYGAEHGRSWPAMHERDDGFPLTAPVGSFPAGQSPYGLFDLEGNVREWTSSPHCPYPEERCGNEIEHVIRGVGFSHHLVSNVEITTREALPKTEALETLGFRCAR